MSWRVLTGDCVELMQGMEPCSVDAVVCDPPYGLEFMGKKWDRLWDDAKSDFQDRPKGGTSPFEGRESPQYVGGNRAQDWHQAWATEALRVIKPGGHLLAFGGTRTSHRLACAIEDAGFEIRDTISWLYGSGFPKSLDVSKAIDRQVGAEREVVGTTRSPFRMADPKIGNVLESTQSGDTRQVDEDGYIIREQTAPATPEAQQWQGWGTALKPAHEPIVVARKPLAGTVAQTVLEHGTGGLNVDGCRIEGDVPSVPQPAGRIYQAVTGRSGEMSEASGRWPANVVLGHHPDCAVQGDLYGTPVEWPDRQPMGSAEDGIPSAQLGRPRQQFCHPDCPVRLLDEQTGELGKSDGVRGRGGSVYASGEGFANSLAEVGQEVGFGDSGGASRFFLTVPTDTLCVLCGLPCVESAGNPSPRSEAPSATALGDAPGLPSPAPEDSNPSSDTSASSVAASSSTTSATPTAGVAGGSAPADAKDSHAERIVQLARSAVSLCDSCATATAQSVAQWLHDPTQESLAGRGSTNAPSVRILSQSLALVAEGWRSTGITPTTATLSALCGSAVAATTTPIPVSDTADASGRNSRLRYIAKSSRAERNAGLDGFEERFSPTMNDGIGGKEHSRPCTCETFTEWVNEDQQASTPADSDTPPPRATTVPTSEDGSDTSTTGSGSRPTDPSPPGSTSTIGTATSKTTSSEISSLSIPSPTSGSTPPTTGSEAGGSDGAVSAASGSPPTPITTTSAEKVGSSMDAADRATSRSLSGPSSSAGNACPDCGGVVEGERVASKRNVHPLEPTVKPISLMRWLVRLVTPPGGTVLDPFCGSGSTGCAAVLEGFDFVGCEREDEYAAIAEARIAWWERHRGDGEAAAVLAAGEARDVVERAGQGSLF